MSFKNKSINLNFYQRVLSLISYSNFVSLFCVILDVLVIQLHFILARYSCFFVLFPPFSFVFLLSMAF